MSFNISFNLTKPYILGGRIMDIDTTVLNDLEINLEVLTNLEINLEPLKKLEIEIE
jgi:hypothetical protein